MVHDSHGLHHFHKRKRVHQNLEEYPHPNKTKRFFDKGIFVIGIIGPIMTIPQLYKIWFVKETAGVSLASWFTYLLTAIYWLMYGILHKEKPIIVTYVTWVILETLIVIGLIMYR